VSAAPARGDRPGVVPNRGGVGGGPKEQFLITDCHFTSDNQGAYAKARGLQTVVVYGSAWDVDVYLEIGAPLYCMGSPTRSTRLTHRLVAHGVPMEAGGPTVKPGDVVVTDGNGVVVVPIEVLETVLANHKIVQEVEDGIKSAIKSGAPVEEIAGGRARGGAHRIQGRSPYGSGENS
jgi:regulator of RNase E activity RraA